MQPKKFLLHSAVSPNLSGLEFCTSFLELLCGVPDVRLRPIINDPHWQRHGDGNIMSTSPCLSLHTRMQQLSTNSEWARVGILQLVQFTRRVGIIPCNYYHTTLALHYQSWPKISSKQHYGELANRWCTLPGKTFTAEPQQRTLIVKQTFNSVP